MNKIFIYKSGPRTELCSSLTPHSFSNNGQRSKPTARETGSHYMLIQVIVKYLLRQMCSGWVFMLPYDIGICIVVDTVHIKLLIQLSLHFFGINQHYRMTIRFNHVSVQRETSLLL